MSETIERRSAPPVRDEMLLFGAPSLGAEELCEVEASLRSGWLGTGPKVERFERAFAEYKGARGALAVSSATAAMHLGLTAVGIGPGDEVVTTALTFCATINAIAMTGGTPVPVDVEDATGNLDPALVEAAITPRTKAILCVHLAGRACGMAAILEIAGRHGLAVLEDCAHAIETESALGKAGTLGDFGCFSFSASKNLTTGEGGLLLARRDEELERLRVLAHNGVASGAWDRLQEGGHAHYDVVASGYKYGMTDVQAAIGIHQLARIEANWKRRHELWSRYDAALCGLPLRTPAAPEPGTRHAYHMYQLRLDESSPCTRDEFLAGMLAQNVGVGVHYRSLPEHAFYRERYGWALADFPAAVRIGGQTASIPFSPYLSDADVDDVLEAVRRALS